MTTNPFKLNLAMIAALATAVCANARTIFPTPAEWSSIRYALGQIESGNNDSAIGRCHELTRYQIKPALYWRMGGERGRVTHEAHAWQITVRILNGRILKATQEHGSPLSPEAIYLLWNAPLAICLADYRWDRIQSPTLRDRAERFANLYHDHQKTLTPAP